MATLELILKKIEDMDRTMRESFHSIGEKVTALEQGIGRLEERMDRLEERMDRLEEQIGMLEVRIFRSEGRMDSMEVFMEMNFERQQATLDLHSLKLESIIEKLMEHDVLLAKMVTRDEFDDFREQTSNRFDGLAFKVEHLEQEFMVFSHQLSQMNEKLTVHDVAIASLQTPTPS